MSVVRTLCTRFTSPRIVYISFTRLSSRSLCTPQTPFEYHLDSSNCISELLSSWHQQHSTLPPTITFKCLMKVSNLIRTSKRYDTLSSSIFKQLLKASTDNVSLLKPEDLVLLLWLMAKIRWSDYATIAKLTQILHSQIPNLSNKSLNLIIWSLVTLKVNERYRIIINEIVTEVVNRLKLEQFHDHRGLANMCWSLAKAEMWPKYLTAHVQKFLRTQGHNISPHSLSMFLHSLSKSRVLKVDNQVFNVITKMVSSFKDTDQQSLNLILWSIGTQKKYNKAFFERLREEILSGSLVDCYNPRLLATIVWCCARCHYYDHALFDHLTQQVPLHIDGMTTHDLVMVAYSFGYLNYSCPELMHSIADRVVDSIHANQKMTFQALVNLSWACLINEIYPKDLYEICLSKESIERHASVSGVSSSTNIHQLLQLDLASRHEQPHLGLPRLSPHDRLHMLINSALYAVKCESRFHRNVANALTKTYGCVDYLKMETFSFSGYTLDFELFLDHNGDLLTMNDMPVTPHELNAKTIRDIYSRMVMDDPAFEPMKLDLSRLKLTDSTGNVPYTLSLDWFTWEDRFKRRIAVEVDGPIHFAANCTQPLGRTALKTRQLEAFGWNVVSIPYYEWQELGFGMSKMKKYLHEKIKGQK